MKNNHKYAWSNKETFIKDLSNSESMSDFLTKRNLSPSSGNFYTFKKWIHVHEVDIESFNYKKSILKHKIKSIRQTISFDDVFCEKSIVSKKQLRDKIKKENIIEYKCSCGLEGFWQGKPITLQLEHKNGNNCDNRLDNLEYLCPNCHSQTTTYGSKNRFIKNLKQRLTTLKNIKEISSENIEQIAKMWGLETVSANGWVVTHRLDLEKQGISVSLVKKTRTNKLPDIKIILHEVEQTNLSALEVQEIAKKYDVLPSNLRALIKNNDTNLYHKLEDTLGMKNKAFLKNKQTQRLHYLLSINRNNPDLNEIMQYFNLDYSRTLAWIGKYDKQLSKTLKVNLKNEKKFQFKVVQIKVETEKEFSRLQQLLLITNKKQVPTLAKGWNVSATAAKKWIKNNAPEKFAEIYDDALLEKNKVKVIKTEKLDYIKSLTADNFDLNDFIKDYGGNKSGAYSMLSKYNKNLFAHISKTPECIYCNGKTRTSGTTIKAGQVIPRYRCLDCNKSFSLAIT